MRRISRHWCLSSATGFLEHEGILERDDKTLQQRHNAMTWAQHLKRVFYIDVSICEKCGGEAKIIASIEDQAVIEKIPSLGPCTISLYHLQAKGIVEHLTELQPAARASPDLDWLA
jgi:hypothetical protein